MWLGQLDSALTVYQNLIGIDPTYTESYYNIGLIQLDKSEPDSAKHYLKRYLAHNPSNRGLIETSKHLLDSLGQ